MKTRSSRRALSERIDNEGTPAKKRKVDQAPKKTKVKDEILEPHENETQIKPPNNVENFNPGPSTSQVNNHTLKNDDIKENLPLHVMKTEPEKKDPEENNFNIVNNKLLKKKEAPKKTTVKDEILEPCKNERQIKTSNNVENFNPGPSTSQVNNRILKNEDIKENLALHVMKTEQEKDDLEENNFNVVNNKLKKKKEADSDTEYIVEIDVKRQVLEVVLSSDDEDETSKFETKDNKKIISTPMDQSHPSGSSGKITQTRTTTFGKDQIFTIKSEESTPESLLTPKTKKLVLDPSILTPPTGDLWKNAEKYYKCLKFLEQSDLDPEAKEFVPSPKVPKKVADKPAECVVCLEPRETTFVNFPCRHAVTCGPCSDHLELLGKDCPVCRTAIKSRFQIFN